LSPGTSPPPVRIPIRPFLVLMRPLCHFLRACKRKIAGTDWMCKRVRSEPAGKFAIYHKPLLARRTQSCMRRRRLRCISPRGISIVGSRFASATDVTIQPFNVREAMTRPLFLRCFEVGTARLRTISSVLANHSFSSATRSAGSDMIRAPSA
jgi:hypothetical protein